MEHHFTKMCVIPEDYSADEMENDSNPFQSKKFNGNPRNFTWFIQSFEKYISENDIDAATCLDILTESCVGRARERIETFRYVNPAPRALKIALHTLKLHYGNKNPSAKLSVMRARWRERID